MTWSRSDTGRSSHRCSSRSRCPPPSRRRHRGMRGQRRIDDQRSVTAFPMAAGAAPFGVTAGPQGRVRQPQHEHRARSTATTTWRPRPIPSADPLAGWLTSDPSGAIWISERNAGNIGRLSPNGSIVEFPLPAGPDAIPQGSVITPGGILYVTEQGVDAIARLDPRTGQSTEFHGPDARRPAPRPHARPRRCAVVHGAERRPGRADDPGRHVPRVAAGLRAPSPTGSSPDRMEPSGSRSCSGASSAASRWHGDADRVPDRWWAGRDHGRPRRPAVRRPGLREGGRPREPARGGHRDLGPSGRGRAAPDRDRHAARTCG